MRTSTLVGLALLVSGAPAVAQIQGGDVRVSAGIAAFSYTDLDAEDVDIEETDFAITPGGSLRVGFAITELVEAGLDFDAEYNEIEVAGSDEDAWVLGVGPYGALNFALNRANTIFMGPSLALKYRHLDSDATDVDLFQLVVGGELKAFVAENASVDVGIFFSYVTGEGEVSGFDYDVDGFSIGPRVGISIWP